MTQEQKNLLLKDLCSRSPYGVKLQISSWDDVKMEYVDKADTLYSISSDNHVRTSSEDRDFYIDEVKPYLFPLSSMTEEQKDEIRNRFCYEWETDEDVSDLWKHELEFGYALEFIQWCYENHLDIGGLIPKDLAVDATNLNIYDIRI